MSDSTKFQIKERAGHFELWCFEPSVSKQWFFVARRATLKEIKQLIIKAV